MKRAAYALWAAMILAGCATYSLVEPKRTAIGDLYTVEPQIPWSAAKSGKYEIWTVDGELLQQIQFVSGVDNGEPLFRGKGEHEKQSFKKSMSVSEIVELVMDGMAVEGDRKLEAKNLKPFPFGGKPGFRFELYFVTQNGLENAGLVVGSVIRDKLYLIKYTGARAHYFPKYKDHVERIIQSIQMQ
jgi:hypothetical protein